MSPRTRALTGWLSIAALVVAGVSVLGAGFRAPVNFDEAFNLQVVVNLVTGHGYATDGAGYVGGRAPFDYQITTGPTLLLPVAAVTAVLGQHLWVFRIVPTLVSLALLLTWWRIGQRWGGALTAAAGVVGVLMLDNAGVLATQRFEPGSVMGENASVLFVLLAILCARHPVGAGLLLGLAVMTKVVVLLAVPGVLVGVWLECRRRDRAVLPAICACAGSALVPAVAWQAYRISVVGWHEAMHLNGQFLRFLTSSGGSGSTLPGSSAPAHLAIQLFLYGVAGAAAVILGLVAVATARHHVFREVPEDLRPVVLGIATAGVALELWWLLLEGQDWSRHSNQASELLVPLVLILGTHALTTGPRSALRNLLSVAIPLLVVAQVVLTARTLWYPPGPSLDDQRQVAALVAARGHVFHYASVQQDFELTLMAPLSARPLGASGGLLVITGMRGRADAAPCDGDVERYAGYVICRVRASG